MHHTTLPSPSSPHPASHLQRAPCHLPSLSSPAALAPPHPSADAPPTCHQYRMCLITGPVTPLLPPTNPPTTLLTCSMPPDRCIPSEPPPSLSSPSSNCCCSSSSSLAPEAWLSLILIISHGSKGHHWKSTTFCGCMRGEGGGKAARTAGNGDSWMRPELMQRLMMCVCVWGGGGN
jgi:hypothetical protein